MGAWWFGRDFGAGFAWWFDRGFGVCLVVLVFASGLPVGFLIVWWGFGRGFGVCLVVWSWVWCLLGVFLVAWCFGRTFGVCLVVLVVCFMVWL